MNRGKIVPVLEDFDNELFEKKLQGLKDSQESIQSLSSWCLERRQHHKKIVATWLQVLKKVKVEHRLTLFYLANDVIQYSKRKNFEFVESWGTTLQRATTMVRDEKVKHRILRIFKIWDQRQVYDEEFLADLSGLISAAPKKKTDPQPTSTEDFQAALLISTMRSCSTLENATDARLRDFRECNVDIDNAEELCSSLKDRRRVEDAEKEVETAVKSVESYVKALEAEIRERTQVIELLEQADQFYETQRGEVKIVVNAYRNFGSRVKNLKRKLDELLPTLTSPVPSPDINAPSPSPDSDIELPGDENGQSMVPNYPPPSIYSSYAPDYDSGNPLTGDFTNNFSSFMGGNMDFDMRNLFNSDRSSTPTHHSQEYNDSQEAKPIEVINMRPKNANNDFATSTLPGLGDKGSSQSPHNVDYSRSPLMKRMMSNPGSHGGMNEMGLGTPSPYSSQNSQSNVTFDVPHPNSSAINVPLPPPPLPPPIFLGEDNCYSKLPPKFPTWSAPPEVNKNSSKWDNKGQGMMNPPWQEDAEDKSGNHWGGDNEHWENNNRGGWQGMPGKMSETPESPPSYEKTSFAEPVEYNDPPPNDPLLGSSGDVDHRVINIPRALENPVAHRTKAADVDHRNLISLTGSPANNNATNEQPWSGNNNLWPTTDQDYRRQAQQGDNVESVDMEMSDEETDSKKPRGDRDMRLLAPPMPPPNLDMDMRMIPLPGQIPPPPMHFNQAPPDFHPGGNSMKQFHGNQANFHHGNQPNFPHNHQEFHPPPDFMGQQPPDFDNNHFNRQQPDFPGDNRRFPGDHRGRGGRGFNRGNQRKSLNNLRRSRDQQQQRGPMDNQVGGNARPLQPPEMVMVFDDNGVPIEMPDMSAMEDGQPPPGFNTSKIPSLLDIPTSMPTNVPPPGMMHEPPPMDELQQHQSNKPEKGEQVQQEDVVAPGNENAVQQEEPPKQLSEQLEALLNSGKPPPMDEMADQEANNGNFPGEDSTTTTPTPTPTPNKRPLLPNGPGLLPMGMNGPPPPGNSPMDLHPVVIYDYDNPNQIPNFRPRGIVQQAGGFPPVWRGSPRGRPPGGFRGSPRMPWMPPPGSAATNFSPRGAKRGGNFRGAGAGLLGNFRGRGRGTNW